MSALEIQDISRLLISPNRIDHGQGFQRTPASRRRLLPMPCPADPTAGGQPRRSPLLSSLSSLPEQAIQQQRQIPDKINRLCGNKGRRGWDPGLTIPASQYPASQYQPHNTQPGS